MRYIIINTFCVMAGALALFLAYSAFVDIFGSYDAKIYTLMFFFGSFFVATVFGPCSCDRHTIDREKQIYHEIDPDLFNKIKDVITKNLPPRIVQGVQIKVAHPENNKMEVKGVARNVKLEEEILAEPEEPITEDYEPMDYIPPYAMEPDPFYELLNERHKARIIGRKDYI